jgi:hypothetical protein
MEDIIIGTQIIAPIAENQKEKAHASLTPLRIRLVINPEIVYMTPDESAKINHIDTQL